MKTSDFSYYLPEELIAQTPLEQNLLYVKYELVSSILEFGKKFNLSLQQLGVIK